MIREAAEEAFQRQSSQNFNNAVQDVLDWFSANRLSMPEDGYKLPLSTSGIPVVAVDGFIFRTSFGDDGNILVYLADRNDTSRWFALPDLATLGELLSQGCQIQDNITITDYELVQRI